MLQNEASAFVLQIYFYAAPIAAMAACMLVCGCCPFEQILAFFPESESLLDRQDKSSCISISERSEAARRQIGICLNVFKEVEFQVSTSMTTIFAAAFCRPCPDVF